jgi:hypothetical protein
VRIAGVRSWWDGPLGRLTARTLFVLAAVSALTFAALIAALFRHSAGEMDPIRRDLQAELAVPGEVRVELTAGRHDLWAIDPGGDGFDSAHDVRLVVTVTGADGTEAPVREVRSHAGYDVPDSPARLAVLGSVEIPRTDVYVVEARPRPGAVATRKAGIGPPVEFTLPVAYIPGIILSGLAAMRLLIAGVQATGRDDRRGTLAA